MITAHQDGQLIGALLTYFLAHLILPPLSHAIRFALTNAKAAHLLDRYDRLGVPI